MTRDNIIPFPGATKNTEKENISFKLNKETLEELKQLADQSNMDLQKYLEILSDLSATDGTIFVMDEVRSK